MMEFLAKSAALPTLALALLAPAATAQWSDDFESYALDSDLEGQGGWHGWSGGTGSQTKVKDTYAYDGTQSIRIASGADTVQEFDIQSGQWVFTGQIYVPSTTTGQFFFIMLNEYNVGGPHEWSVQLNFNASTGKVVCDCGSAVPNEPSIVYDAWAEIRAEIDLDGDSVSLYYNDDFIATYLWSEGVFGGSSYANRHIEAIDLYPNPSSFPGPVFMDAMILREPDAIGDNYCTSTPNSTGSAATISAEGSASVAANNLTLVAEPIPNQPGLFYYGPSQVQIPFGNGFRCVGGQLFRLPVLQNMNNEMRYDTDYTQPPMDSGSGEILAGSTFNFQSWFRDPAGGGAFFNLSDGLEITFQP